MEILLIEDDPFLTDIYTSKLKKAGFEVDVAPDGGKAFQIVKEKKPSLILLDVVLPQMEGWTILKRIKEDSEMDGMKIIILSNLGQRSEVEKGLQLGADRYLIKSQYTPSEVVAEVKKLLG